MSPAQQKAGDDLVLELRGLFQQANKQLTVAKSFPENLPEIQYQQERVKLLQELLMELQL